MYIPKHFDVSDQNELLSFIAANSFGQFISKVGERPFCTHLPFLLSEDKEKLIGHLADCDFNTNNRIQQRGIEFGHPGRIKC